MAEQKLELVVDIDDAGFVSGIKKLEKGSDQFQKKQGKNVKKQKKSLKSLGKAIKSVGNIYTAVIGAAVIGALGKAIKKASDFNEENAKFQTTFALVGKEANKMRNELVSSYNMSTSAATKLMSTTGDMLTGFGFAADEALKLSGETNKLAADLASFANIPVAQASEAITKGLLGEREMMKTLGIAINETDLKQRLMAEGKDKLTGMALRQAKAELTLKMAMEQSKNAIGDVARTQDSFANQMKKVKASVDDIIVVIGQELVAQVKPAIKAFNDFVKSEEGMKKIQNTVKGIMIGFIVLKGAVEVVVNQIKYLFNQVMSVGKTIASVFRAITEKDFKALKEALSTGAKQLKDNFISTFNDIKSSVSKNISSVQKILKKSNAAQIKGINDVASTATIAEQKKRAEAEKTVKANEKAEKEKTENAKKMEEARMEIVQAGANVAIEAINAVAEASKRKTDEKLAQIEAEREAELEKLEFDIDTRNQFSEALAEIAIVEEEEEIARLERELAAAVSANDTQTASDIQQDLTKKKLQMDAKKRDEEIKKASVEAERARLEAEEGINTKHDKRAREEKRKAFKKQKAADLISAGIKTALAIVSMLSAGFPIGIVMAALAGVTGAIQMGIIASKPMPEFAGGGFTGSATSGNSSSNDSMVAKLSAEENVFNKGQSKNLHSALDAAGLLSSGSGNKINGVGNNISNNQRSIVIHGNVSFEKPDDMFNKDVSNRLAKGGTFS